MKVGIKNIQWPKIYDTMLETKGYCKLPGKLPGTYKSPKLPELAEFLGVSFEGIKLHDSSCDVELTKRCFIDLYHKGLADSGKYRTFYTSEDPLGEKRGLIQIQVNSSFDFRGLLKELFEKENKGPANIEILEAIQRGYNYSDWKFCTTIEKFLGESGKMIWNFKVGKNYREFLIRSIFYHNRFLCISSNHFRENLKKWTPTDKFKTIYEHELQEPYENILRKCTYLYTRKFPWNNTVMLKFLCSDEYEDLEDFGIPFEMRNSECFKELILRNRGYRFNTAEWLTIFNGKL